jgi:hypothetical protein
MLYVHFRMLYVLVLYRAELVSKWYLIVLTPFLLLHMLIYTLIIHIIDDFENLLL